MKRINLGLLAMLVLGMRVGMGYAEEEHLVMGVTMASAEFGVGEPVAFALEFDNPSGENESVILGPNGIGNVRIELSDGRETRRFFPPPTEGGISIDPCLTPVPGHPAFEGMFLDTFVQHGLKPGEYRMTASLVPPPYLDFLPPPEGTRWVLPAPAETAFRVVEATDEVMPEMEKRLEQWLQAARTDNDPVWRRWDARRAILLSRHPAALAVQEAWLRDGACTEFDEFRLLVAALLDADRVEALQSLIANVLEKEAGADTRRKVLLHALKQRGALEWKDGRAALLAPWREDIRRAGPMSISD